MKNTQLAIALNWMRAAKAEGHRATWTAEAHQGFTPSLIIRYDNCAISC